jgi:hypothetical protein
MHALQLDPGGRVRMARRIPLGRLELIVPAAGRCAASTTR